MKLSLLLSSLSAFVCTASASTLIITDNFVGGHGLAKRDKRIPYSNLPSTTCNVPSTCSSIGGNVSCRCSDIMTTCINTQGQYCWGSSTLTSTSCPTIPDSCKSTLASTASCLCNSNNVLCVDNSNTYCYGTISGSNVSLTAIPYAQSSGQGYVFASSTAAAASSAAPAATSSASLANTMSVEGAPSGSPTAEASASPTSGSNKLTGSSSLALGLAMVAYMALY
ncbi:hypothetical protein A0J61_06410 [Choanephora cucurbitarum]|uniref:Uncharacterized protein n=1 Tax=Choanephora cucurbitarum TaxID=101091 RepID=A0A1C7N8W7_9FUNG|nr:hypothetical protein A0J61_06410 [Choanephora cucurbitarum]